jgi:hypothetical protein
VVAQLGDKESAERNHCARLIPPAREKAEDKGPFCFHHAPTRE